MSNDDDQISAWERSFEFQALSNILSFVMFATATFFFHWVLGSFMYVHVSCNKSDEDIV